MITVVLADDHPMVRSGLRGLMDDSEDIQVVAEASDGAEAIAAAAAHHPQVVVMDLGMPRVNGIEATRVITSEQPDIRVLVLTMFEDDVSVLSAVRAGACGYVLKGAEGDTVLRAVRGAAAGEAVFGPGVAQHVLSAFAVAHDSRTGQAFPVLTAREHQVLDVLARGLDNRAIAAELGLSTKTVANNVSAILLKLQLADRAQAIVRARDAGLGRQPQQGYRL